MANHRFGRPIFFAGFVLLVASVGSAQSEKTAPSDGGWTTNGPAGGAVLSLVADPANPSHLFAGTELGLFRSEDGGHSWTTSPAGPPDISALALDPSNSLRLYAGSQSGLFSSSDGGVTLERGTFFNFPIVALAIDPQATSTVYAGGPNNGIVYQSVDAGDSWTARSGSADLVHQIASLVVDPSNSANILAGGADYTYSYYYAPPVGSIIGSSDAGQTWRVFLPGGGASQTVQVLAFDPHSTGTVYAAKGNGIYRSFDGGATWTNVPSFHLGSQITSLALDSLTPGTMYAGTDRGVFRSTDRGSHWALVPGPSEFAVSSLALDSLAQVLHVGTANGVYEADAAALGAAAPSFPCQPAVDSLCLEGGRFRVRAQARDRAGRLETGHAVAETDGFGYFSLPAFTGDVTLPEILIKMVDADVAPWNSEWVFFSGLTDVSYIVTVTDTTTGDSRSYLNDPNSPFCGGADTSAFPAAAGAASIVTGRMGTLRASGDDLALMSGRFRLTLSATDPRSGATTSGTAIVRDDRFGYFSLPGLTGDPNLPEVFVKMIDGRRLTNTFWFFFGGLTNVGYTLTLEDTVSGETRTYQSPGAFCSAADTAIPGNVPSPARLSTVSGTISDGDRPVFAARVSLRDNSQRVQETTTTLAGGRFTLRGVPPGIWTLTAETDARWGSIRVRVPPDADDIALAMRYDSPGAGGLRHQEQR